MNWESPPEFSARDNSFLLICEESFKQYESTWNRDVRWEVAKFSPVYIRSTTLLARTDKTHPWLGFPLSSEGRESGI